MTTNPYDELLVTIPPRQDSALTGSAFAKQILNATGAKREEQILVQYMDGNVPSFMRNLQEVTVQSGSDTAKILCLPDYLCIGSDDDYFRTPMFPGTGQKVADLFSCLLPTRKIVNEIWKASSKFTPTPLSPNSQMVSTQAYFDHNKVINNSMAKLGYQVGQLLGGHKKDVVICRQIPKDKVVIYGWHQSNGVAIQGMNSTSHSSTYVDYSHGFRLICNKFLLNGQPESLADFLKRDSGKLLSDEGPMVTVSY